MLITAHRSGGYTGWTEQLGPTDTKAIEPSAAESIVRTLEAVDFFSMPADIKGESHPEVVAWSLEVEDNGARHSVSWIDSSNDDRLPQLYEVINTLVSAGSDWTRS